ncbi:MAG: hypothetical protein Q7R64_02945, partial [bacterium]|nr:hypothetical protein [bacterium]
AILRQFSHAILRYQIAKTGRGLLALRIIPTKNFTGGTTKNIQTEFFQKFSFDPEIKVVDTLPFTERGKSVVIVDEMK